MAGETLRPVQACGLSLLFAEGVQKDQTPTDVVFGLTRVKEPIDAGDDAGGCNDVIPTDWAHDGNSFGKRNDQLGSIIVKQTLKISINRLVIHPWLVDGNI